MTSATGFHVLIIGAGITGPALAILLSRFGHSVILLEKYPKLHDYGAGVEIHPNGVRVLRHLGLTSQFEKFVHRVGLLVIRDGLTGEMIGIDPYNQHGFADAYYGDEIWSANWKDCQRTLVEAAQQHGTQVVFGAEIEGVNVEESTVTLRSSNDKKERHEIKADVIIGADGIDSLVRSSIPALAHIKPVVAEEQCWRSTISLAKIRSVGLDHLLDPGNEMIWTAPGKYILGAPSFASDHYDVITCVQRPINLANGRWGIHSTPHVARKDFHDFCSESQRLLKLLDTSVMWTLAEVPAPETCRSRNGRVVLTGDAWHAMLPHVGNGTASALEDAACLAECLDWSYRQADRSDLHDAIARGTAAYEALRTPRIKRVQKAGHEGFAFLGSKDAEFVESRDKTLKQSMLDLTARLDALRRGERPEKEDVMASDIQARFPTEPFRHWLSGYDVVAVTRAELKNWH